MEVLRIHLKQNSANYKRPEVIENKMTYPLPPYSTVIGALHNAAGFKDYHEMELSIQGDYRSLQKKAYRDNMFLDTTFDDRGILVKMRNTDCLSTGYDRVATALKSMGNSFKNGITISVENEELLEEYRNLKKFAEKLEMEKKKILNPRLEQIKMQKKELSLSKKNVDKNSDKYQLLLDKEKALKDEENELKNIFNEKELNEYKIPYSRFRTLNTSIKYYEILNDIELFIHVKSDKQTLQDILRNIDNLTSIGRSEDFIELVDASIINVEKPEHDYQSLYHGYVNARDYESVSVFSSKKGKAEAQGTKYYLNKKYEIIGKKRIFEKIKVYYLSNYYTSDDSENVFVDNSSDIPLILSFA